MKHIIHGILLAVAALNYSACCRSLPPQPSRPTSVEGWSDPGGRAGLRAVLLLKKGESSEHSKIGVRVTDIAEAEQCGDVGIAYHRRATIQFYNPADGRVLCEEVITAQGNSRIRCAEAAGVGFIAGRAINTGEGWVLFHLRD